VSSEQYLRKICRHERKEPKTASQSGCLAKGHGFSYGGVQINPEFPERELYGLSSQLRRAALSVPSNIAEGAADRTHAQFSHFLSTALGSLNEIDTQLELSFRLGYLSEYEYSKISALLDECLAVTYGLRKSITAKLKR
jgi:four helix bundle protein